MFKTTPTKRVLFVHSLQLWLLVLVGVFSFAVACAHLRGVASADTANTVNFQARLQSATGAIVPDGSYNVEFKLYNADSGGSALWTEDYLNSASNGLATTNGYLSAQLGSETPFPGSIDWSQKLWLTMNIGGTTTTVETLVWDGEMSPRLSMTAQPYAFQAGQAAKADELSNTTNGNTSLLTFEGSSSGDQTFQLDDQGTAGTYHLLTQEKADANYLALQTGTVTAQAGGFGVQTGLIASDNSTAFAVQDADSHNVLAVDTTTSTVSVANFAATGTVSIASGSFSGDLTVSGTANLADVNISGTLTIGSSGNAVSISGGGIVASGTARHDKTITLSPQYAGAITGALDDANCTGTNSGTLANGYDTASRDTYYAWTDNTNTSTSQCTDVLVRVKLPSDFSGWTTGGTLNIQALTSSVANTGLDVQVLDATGAYDTNYNYASQTLTTSWANANDGTDLANTYTAGDTIVLRLRLSAKNAATIKLGDITLTYKSAF